VYWNPAGLAGGSYFSLVIDGGTGKSTPNGEPIAGSNGGWLLGVATPVVGVSYYRLRAESVRPTPQNPDLFTLDSLVTHHAGVSLVQSLFGGLSVGATVRLIRGIATSVAAPVEDPDDLLEGWDAIGRTSNHVDFDLGFMLTGAVGRAGVTIRNMTEPEFELTNGGERELERQIRAGASVLLLPRWKLAGDVDFTKNRGPFGDVREVALGTEAQVLRRVAVRGGTRFNTVGDRGKTPSFSVGSSVAVFGSLLVDAQVTAGSDESLRGWGLAGRVVF